MISISTQIKPLFFYLYIKLPDKCWRNISHHLLEAGPGFLLHLTNTFLLFARLAGGSIHVSSNLPNSILHATNGTSTAFHLAYTNRPAHECNICPFSLSIFHSPMIQTAVQHSEGTFWQVFRVTPALTFYYWARCPRCFWWTCPYWRLSPWQRARNSACEPATPSVCMITKTRITTDMKYLLTESPVNPVLNVCQLICCINSLVSDFFFYRGK